MIKLYPEEQPAQILEDEQVWQPVLLQAIHNPFSIEYPFKHTPQKLLELQLRQLLTEQLKQLVLMFVYPVKHVTQIDLFVEHTIQELTLQITQVPIAVKVLPTIQEEQMLEEEHCVQYDIVQLMQTVLLELKLKLAEHLEQRLLMLHCIQFDTVQLMHKLLLRVKLVVQVEQTLSIWH